MSFHICFPPLRRIISIHIFDGNYRMFFIFMFQQEVLVEREFYVQEDVAAT